MSPYRGEVHADEQDPHDVNFCYTGKLIAIRNQLAHDELRWSRLYIPTKDCLEWDRPPSVTNVAIGTRTGWVYATLKVTGKTLVRVPGGGYAAGLKGKVTYHQSPAMDGIWEQSGPYTCWVVTPVTRSA